MRGEQSKRADHCQQPHTRHDMSDALLALYIFSPHTILAPSRSFSLSSLSLSLSLSSLFLSLFPLRILSFYSHQPTFKQLKTSQLTPTTLNQPTLNNNNKPSQARSRITLPSTPSKQPSVDPTPLLFYSPFHLSFHSLTNPQTNIHPMAANQQQQLA